MSYQVGWSEGLPPLRGKTEISRTASRKKRRIACFKMGELGLIEAGGGRAGVTLSFTEFLMHAHDDAHVALRKIFVAPLAGTLHCYWSYMAYLNMDPSAWDLY